MADGTCQKCFVKFCVADFSLDGAPWSGRPVEVDSDQIGTLMENSQHYTMQDSPICSEHLSQALEITCTSLVMFIALMFDFHIS